MDSLSSVMSLLLRLNTPLRSSCDNWWTSDAPVETTWLLLLLLSEMPK